MLGKVLTLIFAGAGLVSAVLYAQSKAEKNENPTPVFESSKSGLPRPLKSAPESVTPKVQKKDIIEEVKQEGKLKTEQIAAEKKKKVRKKKSKKNKIMPTSKSLSID